MILLFFLRPTEETSFNTDARYTLSHCLTQPWVTNVENSKEIFYPFAFRNDDVV